MDPLLDLIRLLRPQAALFGGGLDAFGEWGVSFRKRDDLLFCWIEKGECQLIRPQHPPLLIRQGDFVLVRTVTPFTLASEESADAVDSEDAVAAAQNVRLTLGKGPERPITLHAGKFIFDTANDDLLAGLLPPLVHIAADDMSSGRIRALLAINQAEASQPGPASAFILTRLVELILVEILRSNRWQVSEDNAGLLAGLADSVAARALAAMHGNVSHDWTLEELAKLCGVSRTSFANRFRRTVGMAPIAYLLRWRMAYAKDMLSRGTESIGEIAFAIGFQSASAFTTAFTRAVGCSPRRFALQTTRAR